MNLRDKCEELFIAIMGIEFEKYTDHDMEDIARIEAFAREMLQQGRNEVVSHAEKHEGEWNDQEDLIKGLREFAAALAASGRE